VLRRRRNRPLLRPDDVGHTRRDDTTVCRVDSETDLLDLRSVLRTEAQLAGLRTVAETKLLTAASELARNMIRHAGGGRVLVRRRIEQGHGGVTAVFEDTGPGIPSLDLALTDGWSSVGSLGLGLPGAQRLVDEFDVTSGPDGTLVSVTVWAR
jgi:serine/threonine-protein kinase RsbT